MKQPPKILHLATHGFYLTKEEDYFNLQDHIPMVLSGLALTNANNGIKGLFNRNEEDGLLFSLEISSLNLQIFAYELILICINFFPLPPNLSSKNYLLFS